MCIRQLNMYKELTKLLTQSKFEKEKTIGRFKRPEIQSEFSKNGFLFYRTAVQTQSKQFFEPYK